MKGENIMAYQKNSWNTGDTITATKLNNMENGIVSANVAATPTTAGQVKQMANIPALSGAPTQSDFNGLLTALQNAGIMAAAE